VNVTIDLELLSIFGAVSDAASFSKAAKKLGVTTATVSRGIAKLETLVGVELVHRTTRRVSLSTAGAALYERSASHVGALREAVKALPERQEEPAGTLRLTAPYDLGVTLLGDVMARFTARYPNVQIEADLTNRNVDIVAEGFDLAIRGDYGRQPDSSLAVRRIVKRVVAHFYASPGYIARRGTPRVVGSPDHEWILFGPLNRRLDLPRNFKGRITANDFLFLREATRSGAGVGIVPVLIAAPYVQSGDLIRVLPGVALRVGGVVLLYPSSGPLARKVIAFRDLMIETIKRESFE